MLVVFDVGATKTRMALTDGRELNEVVRYDTDRGAAGFEALTEQLRQLMKGQSVQAVVGALPGQVDPTTGLITRVTNMPAWNGIQVTRRLERALGCPVHLENDVVLVGLGEATAVQAKGVMAYYTISSGVNAVRLVDGQVDHSIRWFDLGQQLISDGDGKVVTLESLAGGAAFERRRGQSPSMVRDGRVWRAEEHYLARALYNTVLYWTPELVVLGGSMVRDIDLTAVGEELGQLEPALLSLPMLEKARLGDIGGLMGAMAWFWQLAGRK